jgi:hypothetical protein
MIDGNVVEAQIVEGGVFLRVFLPLRPQFQPRDDVKLSDEEDRKLVSDNALSAEYNQRVVKSVRLGALVWPEVK